MLEHLLEVTIHCQVCIETWETGATWTYLQVPSCVFLTAVCVVVDLLAVAGVAADTNKTVNLSLQQMNKRGSVTGSSNK